MARSYYKIRSLSKRNAISLKCALILFLLTTSETVLRILSFGLFLYIYKDDGNLDPVLALKLYYGHVLIMFVFNILFNRTKPSPSNVTSTYFFGLLFNSLSSMFSYNHFEYELLLDEDNADKKVELQHQPSLIRQVFFYAVFIIENVVLNVCTVIFFNSKNGTDVINWNDLSSTDVKSVDITDGFGGKFPLSRRHLHWSFGLIWGLQVIAFVLRFFYYAGHPSSVSVSEIKSKTKVFLLGNEIKWKSKAASDAENALQGRGCSESDEDSAISTSPTNTPQNTDLVSLKSQKDSASSTLSADTSHDENELVGSKGL